jgi:hypothetical protein
MANPNIVNVSAIYGNTTYLTPANTTANVLLANAAASGTVLKVNQIVASNTTSSAATTTVSVNTAAAGSGTSYPIAGAISVPANASLIVVDKTTQLYLLEDKSILVTSGTSSAITYTISYETIS